MFRRLLPKVAVLIATAIVANVFAGSQFGDSAGDGTPDFLRLTDPSDQEAFRRWFTFLAEIQFFTPTANRPPEIEDCAALLRYAYREALRSHATSWASTAHLPLVPALGAVRKYAYPHTPLGPGLFRIRGGTFQPSDISSGAFAQFADAETLQRFNTFLVTRDIRHARPGDLLFFRRAANHVAFHSMVFIGASQVSREPSNYLVYHTGRSGSNEGKIRRLTIEELLHYPDPEWQPRVTNPVFLGVYRWNILKINQ